MGVGGWLVRVRWIGLLQPAGESEDESTAFGSWVGLGRSSGSDGRPAGSAANRELRGGLESFRELVLDLDPVESWDWV